MGGLLNYASVLHHTKPDDAKIVALKGDRYTEKPQVKEGRFKRVSGGVLFCHSAGAQAKDAFNDGMWEGTGWVPRCVKNIIHDEWEPRGNCLDQ